MGNAGRGEVSIKAEQFGLEAIIYESVVKDRGGLSTISLEEVQK